MLSCATTYPTLTPTLRSSVRQHEGSPLSWYVVVDDNLCPRRHVKAHARALTRGRYSPSRRSAMPTPCTCPALRPAYDWMSKLNPFTLRSNQPRSTVRTAFGKPEQRTGRGL